MVLEVGIMVMVAWAVAPEKRGFLFYFFVGVLLKGDTLPVSSVLLLLLRDNCVCYSRSSWRLRRSSGFFFAETKEETAAKEV